MTSRPPEARRDDPERWLGSPSSKILLMVAVSLLLWALILSAVSSCTGLFAGGR